MPPKGRNKPTPMVEFMKEMREEMEIKHKKKFKFPFDEELYTLCKPFYDELDEQQKQVYKDRAKAEWTGIRDDKNKKLTSQGIPVAVIEREIAEKRERTRIEYMQIEKQFAFDIHTILPIEIVVMHVNWFCKVSDDYYVPAEVALAVFSLKDGIIDTYHCFPYFEFPPGTKGDSKAHSDRTHRIPIFDFSEKTKKNPEIFREIMKFLRKNIKGGGKDAACYPIYTMSDNVTAVTSRNAVRSFLNDIVAASNIDDTGREDPHEKYFKLYDLSKLMLELKLKDTRDANARLIQYLSVELVSLTLNADTFLQSPHIACPWHDERDLIPHCSLSHCISWVFIVCDQTSFMNYPRIPGKHMPHDVQLDSSAYDQDDEYVLEDHQYEYVESEFEEMGSIASNYNEHALPDQMSRLELVGRRCRHN